MQAMESPQQGPRTTATKKQASNVFVSSSLTRPLSIEGVQRIGFLHWIDCVCSRHIPPTVGCTHPCMCEATCTRFQYSWAIHVCLWIRLHLNSSTLRSQHSHTFPPAASGTQQVGSLKYVAFHNLLPEEAQVNLKLVQAFWWSTMQPITSFWLVEPSTPLI